MSLVEDILDLSKIQISKFDLTYSWFSFHELVSETLEMCAYQAMARKIKLLSHINFSDKTTVHSDRKRIKQVLVNLINNAIKFTYTGSVTVIADIEHKYCPDEAIISPEVNEPTSGTNALAEKQPQAIFMEEITDYQDSSRSQERDRGDRLEGFDNFVKSYLRVQVIDTGVGISEDDQKHLFKIFGKLKTTYHIN